MENKPTTLLGLTRMLYAKQREMEIELWRFNYHSTKDNREAIQEKLERLSEECFQLEKRIHLMEEKAKQYEPNQRKAKI